MLPAHGRRRRGSTGSRTTAAWPATCTNCPSPTGPPSGQQPSAGGRGSCTRCGRCSGNSASGAFVYEALGHAKGRPERSFDLITRTGLSRTAVYQALETLGAPRDGAVVLVPGTGLQLLAEQFGYTDTVRALITRHRHERAQYRRALRTVDQHHVPTADAADVYLWPPEPPPDTVETPLEMLEREVGAIPVAPDHPPVKPHPARERFD